MDLFTGLHFRFPAKICFVRVRFRSLQARSPRKTNGWCASAAAVVDVTTHHFLSSYFVYFSAVVFL